MQAFDYTHSDHSMACLPFHSSKLAGVVLCRYVVTLVSRLPTQIVEETVTYGGPQGTSPYLVISSYYIYI